MDVIFHALQYATMEADEMAAEAPIVDEGFVVPTQVSYAIQYLAKMEALRFHLSVKTLLEILFA